MSYTDTYPYVIFQQVLLLNGEIIDWKVGNNEKNSPLDWTIRFNIERDDFNKLTMQKQIIIVNNAKEHDEAFENKEWFKQFKMSESMKGFKPY